MKNLTERQESINANVINPQRRDGEFNMLVQQIQKDEPKALPNYAKHAYLFELPDHPHTTSPVSIRKYGQIIIRVGFVYCDVCDIMIKVKENHSYTKSALKTQRRKERIMIGKTERKECKTGDDIRELDR